MGEEGTGSDSKRIHLLPKAWSKFAPSFDEVCRLILEKDHRAILVILAYSGDINSLIMEEQFGNRLLANGVPCGPAEGPEARSAVRLAEEKFHSWMVFADVLLESAPFSGFTTTLKVAHALPFSLNGSVPCSCADAHRLTLSYSRPSVCQRCDGCRTSRGNGVVLAGMGKGASLTCFNGATGFERSVRDLEFREVLRCCRIGGEWLESSPCLTGRQPSWEQPSGSSSGLGENGTDQNRP